MQDAWPFRPDFFNPQWETLRGAIRAAWPRLPGHGPPSARRKTGGVCRAWWGCAVARCDAGRANRCFTARLSGVWIGYLPAGPGRCARACPRQCETGALSPDGDAGSGRAEQSADGRGWKRRVVRHDHIFRQDGEGDKRRVGRQNGGNKRRADLHGASRAAGIRRLAGLRGVVGPGIRPVRTVMPQGGHGATRRQHAAGGHVFGCHAACGAPAGRGRRGRAGLEQQWLRPVRKQQRNKRDDEISGRSV